MTSFSPSPHSPSDVRQSVIEAFRRLEAQQKADARSADEPSREEEFRVLTEQLPVPVLVVQGGTIRYANAGARHLVAQDEAEPLQGREVTDLVVPGEREALSGFLGRVDAGGLPARRFRLIQRQGPALPVTLSSSSLPWGGGKAVALALSPVPVHEVPSADRLVGVATEIRLPEPWSPPNAEWVTDIEVKWPGIDPENWPYGKIPDPFDDEGPATNRAEPPLIDAVGVEIVEDGPLGEPTRSDRAPDRDDAPAFGGVEVAIAGVPDGVPSLDLDFNALARLGRAVPRWDAAAAIGELNAMSARAAAKAAVLEKAQRLSEAALAVVTDAIAILDASADGFPTIFVNVAFERLFGRSFDEVTGRPYGALYGDAIDPSDLLPLRNAMADRRSACQRVRLGSADGATVWCDVTLSVARDPDGRETHFILAHDDVTDGIAEAERVRESAARLEGFIQTSTEWFWEFDADLRYAFVSDRYFEITGDGQGDILGKTIYDFQEGVDGESLDALLATLEAARPFSGHVFSRTCADGAVVWFSSDGHPVIDEHGEFAGYRGVARDVTSELAARRALRESVERHRNLSGRLPAMTYQRVRNADGEYRMTFVSDAVRDIYGLEPDEISATPDLLAGHVHPDDREAFDLAFRHAAEGMRPFSIESRLRDVRGHEKWVLTVGRPSPGDGREIVWDCVATDVTSHKRPVVKMQEARDFYRTVLENDDRPVCCLDRQGVCTFANRPFDDAFGAGPTGASGRRVVDLLPAAVASRVMDGARRVFEARAADRDVVELDAGQGHDIAYRLSWAPIGADAAGVDQVQVTWTDVTELFDLEARRREAERYLAVALNAGARRIAYVDRDQRYRFNNRPHQSSLADRGVSAVGRSMREALGNNAYHRTLPHVEAALAGETVSFESSNETDDGTRYFRTTLTPDKAADGAVIGFLSVSEDVTDRRRLENAVEERDRRFLHLAENLPGVVYQRVVDWQGRLSFTFVSDGIRGLLGVEPEEVVADPQLAHLLVHPEDRPRVKEAMEASRIDPVPYDIEIRCLTKDGETVWLRSIAHPYLRAEDNAVVWDGLLVDVTSLRREEAARRELDERFARLVDLCPDAIIVHDDDTIVFANGPAVTTHGAGAVEDLVGLRWTDLVHPDDRANAGTAMRRSPARVGSSEPTEQRRLRLDGGSFLASVRAASAVWNGRSVTIGVVRDISRQRATETALRNSEQRLNLFIERSPDAIYLVSGDRITFANDACARLLGTADRRDLIGTTVTGSNFFASTPAPSEQASAAGPPAWRRRAASVADGTEIHFEEMSLPIDWADEPSLLVICRDVTNRVREERELAAARAEAERLAGSAELANREVERANQARTRFLGGLNREIRTPLNGIIGMSGLLIDSKLGEDQRQHVETIRRSGKALLDTLNDLIDFAQLRQGEAALRSVTFETRPMIESVLDVLSSHAYGKGIDLAAYVAPNVPEWLVGDPGRLRQILMRLVGNGIRFTERGAVTVKVNLAGEVAEDRFALFIRVTDTGCGLEPDVRDRLFRAAVPNEADGVVAGGGLGVGLSICRGLVDLMEGEIGVESELGRGSVFWVKVAIDRPQTAPEGRILPLSSALAGRRTLLIGGNKVTRRLLHKQLRAFGMDVAEASTADQGLAVLADAVEGRAPFDLAVVDLSLTDMEPPELAQRIRHQRRHRRLKLALVAPTERGIGPHRARELGFDTGMKKPLRQDGLVNGLAALFGAEVDDRWFAPSPEPAFPTERRLHLLLAQGNATDREITADMLVRAGHRVDVAGNGIEAVNAARNIFYDLIVMDSDMPEMGGITAARLIRGFNGPHARIPIIGFAGDDDAGACRDAGIEEVLRTPVDPDALARSIARLCADRPDAEDAIDAPRQVPEITPEERRELKDLLASLDGIMENRRRR